MAQTVEALICENMHGVFGEHNAKMGVVFDLARPGGLA